MHAQTQFNKAEIRRDKSSAEAEALVLRSAFLLGSAAVSRTRVKILLLKPESLNVDKNIQPRV